MSLTKQTFFIKRNDTLPAISLKIYDRGCLNERIPFDLTGATGCTFTMVDGCGNYKISSQSGTVVSSSGGTIQYEWADGDTNESGKFKGEFEISYSNGKKLSIPQVGYITIEVFDDLN